MKTIQEDRERFCRSLDYTLVAGKTNPYALLAAAVFHYPWRGLDLENVGRLREE